MTNQNVLSFGKLVATLVVAVLLTTSSATAALATKEERIRTEAIEIFVPTNFKAPQSGCSFVPFKYRWRFFQNHETILAQITIENKKGWWIGDIYLYPDVTGGEGVAEIKICSTRWIGEPEVIEGKLVQGSPYQSSRKGAYLWHLDVTDWDNRKNIFQSGKKPFRLT
jgi:hypothetical protein